MTLLEMRDKIVKLAQDGLKVSDANKTFRTAIIRNIAISLATLFNYVGNNVEQFETARRKFGKDIANATGKEVWKNQLAANFSNVARVLEEHENRVTIANSWQVGNFTDLAPSALLKDLKPAVPADEKIRKILERMEKDFGREMVLEEVNSYFNSDAADFYTVEVEAK